MTTPVPPTYGAAPRALADPVADEDLIRRGWAGGAYAPLSHAGRHAPAGPDSLAASYVARTLYSAKGSLAVAQSGAVLGELPVGSAGQVLTADTAAALGVKWAAPGGIAGLQTPELLTDWRTKPDGALPAAGDEGTPITIATSAVGVPQPVVSGGGVILNGAGAIYVNQPLAGGRKTRLIGAEWTIPTDGTTDDGAMALCAFVNVQINPQVAHIHVAIGKGGWAVQTYNGSATTIKSGSFVPPLAVGTTEHRAEIAVYGDTLRVTLPDGTYVEAMHASVESLTGTIGSWEILQTATSPRYKLREQWAGSDPTQPGELAEHRAARIARRALPWFYDETTGNMALKAAPAGWADFFVAGMIGSNSFFALDPPTLDGHLTRRDWVLAQDAAIQARVIGGGPWDREVYGDVVSNGHRDDVTGALAMSATTRTFLLVLGRVPAGQAITGLRLARTVAQSGGALSASLYSSPTLGATAWTQRAQVAPAAAGTGVIATPAAVAAQATDLWYAVQLVITGAISSYPTWATSPAVPAAVAGLLNPTPGGATVAGFTSSTTPPAAGATLNPTTGWSALAQKPWAALY